MPNPYIVHYESTKSSLDLPQTIIDTLEKLKKDRLSWGVEADFQKGRTFAMRGLFGKIYNVKDTKKNLDIINEIISGISKLNDVNEIVYALCKRFKELTESGETRELLYHIIKDVGAINYTTRSSNLIEPSPMEILTQAAQPYSDGATWSREIEEIFTRKALEPDAFKRSKTVSLDSPIEEHVKWAFDHIYSVGYLGRSIDPKSGIARHAHGIQHVARAAFYVPILANLYRKHGDQSALQLNDEDIKLMQIAALLHDAAREGEGDDLWDHESGILLYVYLTRTLGVNKDKAKMIAEAMANKDPSTAKGYFEIVENGDKIIWKYNKSKLATEKNIYQKIIHDADCLDIIRARPHFDANYMDFYKDFGTKELALEEMATLISQARSLIEHQGDSYARTNNDFKLKRETQDAYACVMNDINSRNHNILHILSSKLLSKDELSNLQLVDTTPYNDKIASLTEAQLKAALREGKVFSRAIYMPSLINPRSKYNETQIDLELQKMFREHGVTTRTKKSDNISKRGNPYRSVSMLGYGANVFSCAGFLIVNPNIANVVRVGDVDFHSGYGKKDIYVPAGGNQEIANTKAELAALNHKLKLGGSSANFSGAISTHTELLYHLDKVDVIYFSNDPTLTSIKGQHRFSPILQALYLQQQYQKKYEQAKQKYTESLGAKGEHQFIERYGERSMLPLYEYSGLHNVIRHVPDDELTENKIMSMWVSMCSDCIDTMSISDLYQMDIEAIKTRSLYGNTRMKSSEPVDSGYSLELRSKINEAISAKKNKMIGEHEAQIVNEIKTGRLSCLSNKAFTVIRHSEAARQLVASQLQQELESEVQGFGRLLPKAVLRGCEVAFNKFGWSTTIDKYLSCADDSNSGFVKLIVLSNYINDEPTKEKIKKLADDYFDSMLSFLTLAESNYLQPNGSLDWFQINKIFSAFVLTKILGLEKHQTHINEMITSIFGKYLADVKSAPSFDGIHTLSELVDNMLMLDPQMQSQYKDDIKTILSSFRLPNEDLDLHSYLHLAKIVDVDVKKNILDYLDLHLTKNLNANVDSVSIAKYVKIFEYFTREERLDLFKIIANKINHNTSKSGFELLRDWKATILILRKSLMGETFSDEQMKIIRDQWMSVCEDILASEKKGTVGAFGMIDVLSVSATFALPIPNELIAWYETNLSDLLSSDVFTRILTFREHEDSDMVKYYENILSTMEKVHSKLPPSDTRENLMRKMRDRVKEDISRSTLSNR